MPSIWRPSSSAAILAAVALLTACGEENRYVAPPPPKVTVAVPTQRTVTEYLEATGNTSPVNSANLVARVQGFLTAVDYKDGDQVTKGTVLFTIEPEPYRLKLEQSQAAERGAEATVRQTEADYQRQSDLVTRQAASKAAYDNALANRDSAQAKLMQAKADTATAAINLGYTEVRAPFDGIVSARQVSVGELVGSGQPTVLATIVQLQPIYVNFTINEQDVQRIRAEMKRRGIRPEDLKKIPVEVGLQTEDGYPHKGTLDYAAPTLTQSTGTLLVRGVLENEDRALLPGYFVRVRVPISDEVALLVPDIALGSDQGGAYVLVVNKDNVVEQRKVATGQTVGTLRVITNGLSLDDRVVVAGGLRAIPGQTVEPQRQAAAAVAN
jgi:RND family efflux transporter MFP subunit